MTNTVIAINQGQYTERVVVNANNAEQVKREIEGKEWSVVVEGNYKFETTNIENWAMFRGDNGKYENATFEVRNGKYKFLGDTCGMVSPRFQKIKKTGKGDYLNIMGQRYYFGVRV